MPARRQLIQVAQNIDQPATREREVRGLSDAMREFKVSRGLILAEHNEPPIEEKGKTIEIRSAVEWLASPM